MSYKVISGFVFNNSVQLISCIESSHLLDSLVINAVSIDNVKLEPVLIKNNDKVYPSWSEVPSLIYYNEPSKAISNDSEISVISKGAVSFSPDYKPATKFDDARLVYTNYKCMIDEGSYFDLNGVSIVLVNYTPVEGTLYIKVEYIDSSGLLGSQIVSDEVIGNRPNFISARFDLKAVKSLKITIKSGISVLIKDVVLHGNRIPV